MLKLRRHEPDLYLQDGDKARIRTGKGQFKEVSVCSTTHKYGRKIKGKPTLKTYLIYRNPNNPHLRQECLISDVVAIGRG